MQFNAAVKQLWMRVNWNIHLIAVAGTLALAGCSSTHTEVDAGRIPARTFSSVSRSTEAPVRLGDQRQHVQLMIQTAIRKSLAAHGVAHADSGGDASVSDLVSGRARRRPPEEGAGSGDRHHGGDGTHRHQLGVNVDRAEKGPGIGAMQPYRGIRL